MNNWAGLIQKQQAEKLSYDQQLKQEQQLRKQKYKQELETDIMLKQKKQLLHKQYDQQQDTITLETLRQREQLKLKELEKRKMQQIETSLENLNNQLIKKKINQERAYQKLVQDKTDMMNDRIYEQKSQEKLKLIKENDRQLLRDNYDQQIQQRQTQKQSKIFDSQPNEPLQSRHDNSKYVQDLNQQLIEKKNKLEYLNQKKQEERQKIEQKIAFEKQKLIEMKMNNYELYKQYEKDNLQLLQNNPKNKLIKHQIEQQDLKMNWDQINKGSSLPHIYNDNYYQQERKKQMQYIDQDLQKYSNLQQSLATNQGSKQTLPTPLLKTPLKTPLSQQSKNSKKSKQLLPIPQQEQEGGYAQIHYVKTQTPKSKISYGLQVDLSEHSAKQPKTKVQSQIY
ncbi:hypothetical protein pb186bvf_013869 [Paramecium bursaria]